MWPLALVRVSSWDWYPSALTSVRWLSQPTRKSVVGPEGAWLCKLFGILSHLFIYLFNHYLYHCGFVNTYFVLWFTIQCYFIFLIVRDRAIGNPVSWLLVPVSMRHTRATLLGSNSVLSLRDLCERLNYSPQKIATTRCLKPAKVTDKWH